MTKASKDSTDFYQDVSLDLIDTEGQSVREKQDDDHVVELAMSIAKHGLFNPITLKPKEDGRYQLDAGFHRLCAFHRLRRKTIPAHIRKDNTGSTIAIALVENICRKDMSLHEEVKAVAYLHTEENLSISQICDVTGKGVSWVQRRLMIPSLPENVKQELMEGRISIGHAEAIGRIEQEPVRNLVLNQVIVSKLSVRQTNELADLYSQAPSIDEAISAGVQKAQEIQREAPATRRCEACLEIRRIEELYFMPICGVCQRVIQDNMNPSAAKEVN